MLSGGGAKTAAHVGAARAIDQAGLVPLRYVATSMGAVDAGPACHPERSEGARLRLGSFPLAALGVRMTFASFGATPPVVRANDDAVGTLMAHATAAQLALWRADPKRPLLVYVRPRVERKATFRVDRVRRYADDGHRATREALAAAGWP